MIWFDLITPQIATKYPGDFLEGQSDKWEDRETTALPKLDVIIRYRRLRWLGHLSRMDHLRLPRQALIWEPEGFRRRPGRPRQNWKDVVKKYLKKMGISWDEVEEAAEDRRSWRYCVAQSVFDAGWTRNQEPGGTQKKLKGCLTRLSTSVTLPNSECHNHFCISTRTS